MWGVSEGDFVHPTPVTLILGRFSSSSPFQCQGTTWADGFLGLGLWGLAMGDSSRQDMAARACPKPSQEKGTGAAPGPGIGHLPGAEDSVVLALPARQEATTSGQQQVHRCPLLALFNILLLMNSTFMWHSAFLTLVLCQMIITDSVLHLI